MSDKETFQVFATIARNRRSVRAFHKEPVPDAILKEVFEAAQTAPSNCNTQPWQVHVASGAACDRLREKISAVATAGQMPTWDFPYDFNYPGVYRDRQYAAARTLYEAMGISREDKAGRAVAFNRNYTFFDAPHVAFLFLPEPFGLREAADLGMYAQNLMLALTAHGIGSCPQTALSFYPDIVRAELGIPAEQRLLFGISFGYADESHASSAARTARAALTDIVTFHS
ncbi:MAG: nitroreductase [Gammaproteobacteria bacterium]|nr:MAG: nitroreductase [Gammaproteobacteria bacterium]